MKPSPVSKAVDVVCAALVVATIARLALAWERLPDVIPAHYGLDGSVDGWGGKESALVAPVAMLVVYAMVAIAERHPQSWSTGVEVTEENRGRVYRILRNLLATLKLAVVAGLAAASAVQLGGGPQPWFLFPATIAAVFGGVAYWSVKLMKAR